MSSDEEEASYSGSEEGSGSGSERSRSRSGSESKASGSGSEGGGSGSEGEGSERSGSGGGSEGEDSASQKADGEGEGGGSESEESVTSIYGSERGKKGKGKGTKSKVESSKRSRGESQSTGREKEDFEAELDQYAAENPNMKIMKGLGAALDLPPSEIYQFSLGSTPVPKVESIFSILSDINSSLDSLSTRLSTTLPTPIKIETSLPFLASAMSSGTKSLERSTHDIGTGTINDAAVQASEEQFENENLSPNLGGAEIRDDRPMNYQDEGYVHPQTTHASHRELPKQYSKETIRTQLGGKYNAMEYLPYYQRRIYEEPFRTVKDFYRNKSNYQHLNSMGDRQVQNRSPPHFGRPTSGARTQATLRQQNLNLLEEANQFSLGPRSTSNEREFRRTNPGEIQKAVNVLLE